ncbi:MAG TPA: hypothetical protein VK808_08375 [Bacteroidia bacterium]|nr:hypothetical protein [Bacteroidia bacterium]
MKNPWLAFVLNLLLFGGGYIYNGQRKMLGFALVIAWILIRYGEITIFLTNLVFKDWLMLFAGLVVLMFSLAADGYSEAKSINKNLSK